MKIDELALEEASAKLLRLRLTIVGGRKEIPIETVKSVLKRGLDGMYADEALNYILRRGLQYYLSAQHGVHPTRRVHAVLGRQIILQAATENIIQCLISIHSIETTFQNRFHRFDWYLFAPTNNS